MSDTEHTEDPQPAPKQRTRRKYTDDQKKQAIELYRLEGPTAVERKLGVPKNTVSGWARTAGVRTVSALNQAASLHSLRITNAEKRSRLSRRFLDNADKILDMIEKPTETVSGGQIITTQSPTPSQLKDLMVSTSLSVEKHIYLEEFTGPEEQHVTTSMLDRLASQLGVNELDEEYPN